MADYIANLTRNDIQNRTGIFLYVQKSTGTILYVQKSTDIFMDKINIQNRTGTFLYVQKSTGTIMYVQKSTGTILSDKKVPVFLQGRPKWRQWL